MTGTPDDRFDDLDLDRLLGQAPPVPAMGAGLVDRIVEEAQRPDRVAAAAPAWKPRPSRRAWTRRGVWTGALAVNLIFASAVAAAFGGGVLSVARIRAVAATIVAHIHHPHRHAVAAPHHGLEPHVSRAVPVISPPPQPFVGRAPVPPVAAPMRASIPAPVPIAPVFRGHDGAERLRPMSPHLPLHHAIHVPIRFDRQAMAGRRDRLHRVADHGGPGERGAHALDDGRPLAGSGRMPGDAEAARPADRSTAPMAGGDRRPDGATNDGSARSGALGGASRPEQGQGMRQGFGQGQAQGLGQGQGPWGRGPGFRAGRFGPGGGMGPGQGGRFGARPLGSRPFGPRRFGPRPFGPRPGGPKPGGRRFRRF